MATSSGAFLGGNPTGPPDGGLFGGGPDPQLEQARAEAGTRLKSVIAEIMQIAETYPVLAPAAEAAREQLVRGMITMARDTSAQTPSSTQVPTSGGGL